MKMYSDEKTKRLQWMILFIELFASVNCFIVKRIIKWNEKDEKVLEPFISIGIVLFQIYVKQSAFQFFFLNEKK